MKKRVITLCTVILAGFLFGILAKMGDAAPQGNVFNNLLSGFGRASSGFTLWIFACLLISSKAESRICAAVEVALFLLAMLCAYYTYSKLVVGYLSMRMVKFWALMVLPSAVAGYVVHGIKQQKGLKILVAIAAAFLGIVGIVFIEGLETYSLIIECCLLAAIGILLFKKDKQ